MADKSFPTNCVMLIEFETPESHSPYYHITGRPQAFDAARHEETGLRDITNYGGFSSDDEASYRSLEVYCQGNYENGGLERELYSFKARYRNVYSVELNEAKLMADTLKRLHKSLDRMTEADGYVRSFGQFMLRVCKALKIERMAFRNSDEAYCRSGRRYQFVSLNDGMHRIDATVAEWKSTYREPAAQQA